MGAGRRPDLGGVVLDGLAWTDYYVRFSELFPESTDCVLMYHAVGTPDCYGNVTVDRLRRDLAYLTERYQVVDLPRVTERSDGKRIAVTFDDGYRNFYEQALPVLREFDVPATVFVVSDFVDDANRELHWRLRQSPTDPEYGTQAEAAKTADGSSRPLMTTEHLHDLVEEPLVTIGSHTRTHPDLGTIEDRTRLVEEIRGGKRVLEDRLGVTVDRFSYPYGRRSPAAEAVARTTHEYAVTTVTAPVSARPDPHRIPRLQAHLDEHKLRWELTDARWRLHSLKSGLVRKVDSLRAGGHS